jgi:hypothetical protein
MIKKYRSRTRFIGALDISLNSRDWLSKIFEFKELIRSNSQYQFVDNKIYWHLNRKLKRSSPYLSIIGSQALLGPNISVIDEEEMAYWAVPFDFDLYSLSFDSLELALISALVKIPPEMDENFHLVVEEEKIELHFFLQKDYIS